MANRSPSVGSAAGARQRERRQPVIWIKQTGAAAAVADMVRRRKRAMFGNERLRWLMRRGLRSGGLLVVAAALAAAACGGGDDGTTTGDGQEQAAEAPAAAKAGEEAASAAAEARVEPVEAPASPTAIVVPTLSDEVDAGTLTFTRAMLYVAGLIPASFAIYWAGSLALRRRQQTTT